MHQAIAAACALAFGSAAAISTATALPMVRQLPGSETVVQTVAQKKVAEDEGRRTSKSKSKTTSGQNKSAEKSKQAATRYGSVSPSVSVPLTIRGSQMYSPSFNGAYSPPGGYSGRGYPIRYADEAASAQAECAALRRNALASGKRSAWDRYYACSKD